jgi:tRNA 5-methylaminomethyl-2-thiouridine biosynthesis bifunctional protein
MTEPLDWSGPAPRSPRFDDIYFSPADGLAEAREVFLRGCGLPEAWRGRQRFVVSELGFGTGLNVLALIDLWRTTRPTPTSVLHIFSVEAFPMSREDAGRALSAWPDLADLASPLLAQWPRGRDGFHRIEWQGHGAILDLAILEAEPALAAWSGFADGWFLDGFAPSKNPQMWRPEVLNLVAARSAPDARAATFSVAGAVRRGLQAAGFEITRAPGFGRKKERLEARLAPTNDARRPARRVQGRPRIAVIGAGIAGAALARAFRGLGHETQIIDADRPGAGGSGNLSALVTPRLDAGRGPGAALHAQAFARAVQLYRRETPGAIIAEGALQLATQPRDEGRFSKITDWRGFDPGAIERLDAGAAAAALTEAQAPAALSLRDALVVDPAAILEPWIGQDCIRADIIRLDRDDGAWRLADRGGQEMRADIVCLAGGPGATRLAAGVRLRPVRGQATFTDGVAFSGEAAAFGGYAIPTRTGVLFGATHDRDDWSIDPSAEDDDRNLRALAEGRPALADRVRGIALSARASLRAMSPDHLPLAGAVAGSPGLFVLSGFGGRGFTLAPLLAEAVAAEALGAPSPLPRALARLVDPGRFGEP